MTDFAVFALHFGALLAMGAVAAGWVFRTSAAPLWIRLALPSLMVALACYAPWSVNRMLGFPVSVTMAELPQQAEVVAFVPRDGEERVDLWLITDATPRAYETTLTGGLKKTLREAAEAMGHGQRAVLTKRAAGKSKPGAGDRLGIGDDQQTYVLDPSAMGLPPKE
jgi:hypothetical protein